MVINKRVYHFSDARLSWVIYIGFNRGKSAVSSSDKAKILTKILSESSNPDSSGMSSWVSQHSPSAKLACLFFWINNVLNRGKFVIPLLNTAQYLCNSEDCFKSHNQTWLMFIFQCWFQKTVNLKPHTPQLIFLICFWRTIVSGLLESLMFGHSIPEFCKKVNAMA